MFALRLSIFEGGAKPQQKRVAGGCWWPEVPLPPVNIWLPTENLYAQEERRLAAFPGHWLFSIGSGINISSGIGIGIGWRVNEKIHYLTLIKAYYAHYQHRAEPTHSHTVKPH